MADYHRDVVKTDHDSKRRAERRAELAGQRVRRRPNKCYPVKGMRETEILLAASKECISVTDKTLT